MKVIELFAGSRSIGKAAEQLGLDVWSTDIHPFDGVDLAEDILKLSADDIPHAGEDTILWASPPRVLDSVWPASVATGSPQAYRRPTRLGSVWSWCSTR